MRILKRLISAALVLALLLVVVGLFLPAGVHVERSVQIDAPPANVFTLLNGYHRFNDWSPWADRDPDTIYTYEGPATGVGATMSWHGGEGVDSGSQTIVAVEPDRVIEADLDFGDRGTVRTAFLLAPEAGGTRVTWTLDAGFGWDLVGRYTGLMYDRWVGADYERGLARLEALAETMPRHDLAGADVAVVDTVAVPVFMIAGATTHEPADVDAAMTAAYERLAGHLAARGLAPAGPPLAIAREWSNERYVFDAALPYDPDAARAPAGAAATPDAAVAGERFRLAAEIHAGVTHAGRAARIVHAGPYEALADSWNRLEAFIAIRGLETVGDPWEAYLSDPAETPPAELVTEIYWPVE